MRKFLYLLLGMSLSLIGSSQPYCSKQATKISYSGKPPAPWTIDGQISDWQTILGGYTGSLAVPFMPPETAAFNWVIDTDPIFYGGNPNPDPNAPYADPDEPLPQSDLHFLSFMHDDYNVYFYFRRQAVDGSTNTFYYFLDVNGDATMNNGEPVVHATFTNNTISALTLSRYVTNTTSEYSAEKKGNFMADQTTLDGIHNYPLTGTLVEVFNSNTIAPQEKLKKNEVFAAALTEDGFGVELSIPWRYLRFWNVVEPKGNKVDKSIKYEHTKPLNPGDIFFYHVSMQADGGAYSSSAVVDNAGSCSGGVGISGNVNLDKTISTTTITPGSHYRFQLKYTNLTNAETEIGIEKIHLDVTQNPGSPVVNSDFIITVYADDNCNGRIDAGEASRSYDTEYMGEDYTYMPMGGFEGLVTFAQPKGDACYIIDVALPEGKSVDAFTISMEASVFFVEGREPCEPSCGSKPINQVGAIGTSVGTRTFSVMARKNEIYLLDGKATGVQLYPNPSKGTVTLVLPQTSDVTIEDNLGRTVRRIQKAAAGSLLLEHLRPGFYMIKVVQLTTGKTEVKKLVVQQ